MMDTPPLRSVLHIDDDPEIREVVALALNRVGGFEVRSAPSGRVGLDLAISDPPDFILLDFMMPELDGLSVLALFKAEPGVRDIPVAFLTAHADPQVRDRMRALGAVDVVDKPFRAADLVRRVEASWTEHQQRRG
jgi:CheY-like chemotaxis protein